jgi:hypothetical protein
MMNEVKENYRIIFKRIGRFRVQFNAHCPSNHVELKFQLRVIISVLLVTR